MLFLSIGHTTIYPYHRVMVALVTGTSRGLGRALVFELLQRGVKVVEVSRGSGSGTPESLVVSTSDMHHVGERLAKLGLKLDVVVNNAAMFLQDTLSKLDEIRFNHMINVNVLKPVQLVQSLVGAGALTDECHIVNISSMGGYLGAKKFAGMFSYGVSKAALVGATEHMAAELWPLRVNCLCLGSVSTEMFSQAFPGHKASISPEGMAKFVVDFAMTGGKVATGRVIPVSFSDP